jgi:hypothetical protein
MYHERPCNAPAHLAARPYRAAGMPLPLPLAPPALGGSSLCTMAVAARAEPKVTSEVKRPTSGSHLQWWADHASAASVAQLRGMPSGVARERGGTYARKTMAVKTRRGTKTTCTSWFRQSAWYEA